MALEDIAARMLSEHPTRGASSTHSIGAVRHFKASGHLAAAEEPILRIASWNIGWGRKKDNNIHTLTQNADIANADIIFLQEVDEHKKRSGMEDLPKRIAEATGFYCAYGTEFREAGNGSTGNMILSRYPLQNVKIIRLQEGCGFINTAYKKIYGGRMAITGALTKNGSHLIVCCIHLSTDFERQGGPNGRLNQLEELFYKLEKINHVRPDIIGGDLNTYRKSEPALAYLKNEGYNITFSSGNVSTYMFAKRATDRVASRLEILEERKLEAKGSDHSPIYTVLKLPG